MGPTSSQCSSHRAVPDPLRACPLRGRGPAQEGGDGRVDAPVVLGCRQVAVRFGRLHALDYVELEARPGEIVGLVGPNGAGKTALMAT